ncbi:hypothetical protein ACH4E8_34450 [Streptomyces sp. NPDC017979]|uniref:hypothetical protein n=1 Tax=Streptomyces sp. NPDC017979 TaxID=3365024 RepID=UPI0037A86696
MIGSVAGVPVWLAAFALVALLCILAVVSVLIVLILRRADGRDLPQVLLGLSHVISSLCGLLPWGKPVSPPALPQAPSPEADAADPSVVLVRMTPAVARRGEQ